MASKREKLKLYVGVFASLLKNTIKLVFSLKIRLSEQYVQHDCCLIKH